MPRKPTKKQGRLTIIQTSRPYQLTLALFIVVIVAASGLYFRNKYFSRATSSCVGNGLCSVYMKHFDPASDHFFTTDSDEASNYTYDGVAFVAYNSAVNGAGLVRRFWNSGSTSHIYTMDGNFAQSLINAGWTEEGQPTRFYAFTSPPASPSTVAVHQVSAPGQADIIYTWDTNYIASLQGSGWSDDGIAFYAFGGYPTVPDVSSFRADSYTIGYNSSTTLRWEVGNSPFSCTGGGGTFGGGKPGSGALGTGNITGSTGYSLSCTNYGGTNSRNITVNVNAAPAATVSLLANGSSSTSVATDSNITLAWSTSNASSCNAGNAWGGAKSASSSSEQINVGSSPGTKTYTMSCVNAAGASASSSATVTVMAPAPASPSLTLLANGSSNISTSTNSTITLAWSTANTSSCTASNAWAGAKSASSSSEQINVGGSAGAKVYGMSCANSAGATANSNASVNVVAPPPPPPPPPSVTLLANGAANTSVTTNSNITLAWSTADASSCTATNSWSGAKSAASSSEQVGVGGTAGTKVYGITCANSVGATSNSTVTVAVNSPSSPPPPPPTPVVTLTATPTSIVRGNASTLNWHVANATSCNGAGGQLAGYINPSDGSRSTGILTASTSYALSCTNSAGVATSASASVTVGSQPPPPTPTNCPSGTTGVYPNCVTIGSGGGVSTSGGGSTGTNSGNPGVSSNGAKVVTTNVKDNQPPSSPSDMHAATIASGVSIGWTASSDNIGVAQYVLERSTDQSTWLSLSSDPTATAFADTTTAYGKHYYYRVKALDASGNSSNYAQIDIQTPEFSANVGGGDLALTSSDGIVKVTLPDGAVSRDAACDILITTDGKESLKPAGLVILGGPYGLICRLASGDIVAKLSKEMTISLVPTKDQLKTYDNFKLYGFDLTSGKWQLIKSTYDKKAGTYSFKTDASMQFALLGAKKGAFPWQLFSFIILAILVAGGVFFFLLRRRQQQTYSDYIRRKYYNI